MDDSEAYCVAEEEISGNPADEMTETYRQELTAGGTMMAEAMLQGRVGVLPRKQRLAALE